MTLNGGVALCIDVDVARIRRRLETGYLDELAHSLDDAIARCIAARDTDQALSVGFCGNAAVVVPDDEALARWIRLAGERVAFQGLPARICWLGYGERHRLGLRFNELVRRGEVAAPS